jgi:hypothetical protein
LVGNTETVNRFEGFLQDELREGVELKVYRLLNGRRLSSLYRREDHEQIEANRDR